MSIAVVSLPSLLATVSSQSDELAISEESIMIVKTKISNILGALWDENSKKDSLVGIINAKNGNTQLKAAFRNLDINSSSYRVAKFADVNASSTLGQDGGDSDDIDDFITGATGLAKMDDSADSLIGYVLKDQKLTVSVYYINDSPSAGSYKSSSSLTFKPKVDSAVGGPTNIKAIKVKNTLNGEDRVVLWAFSCNVGESSVKSRYFP